MTPEEKAVVQAAINGYDLSPRLRDAVQRLIYSCQECNTDTHRCGGCGENVGHGDHACADCADRVARESRGAPPDGSTYPCWECTVDEDPAPWCDCRRDDFGGTHPGHACRLRAHDPKDCLNRPSVNAGIDDDDRYGNDSCQPIGCDAGIHIPGCKYELIWVARTWVDVRAGDCVRIPHPTFPDKYLQAYVYTAVRLPWHVDPRTGTSSFNPPVALEWQSIRVRFKDDAATRDMDPAKPVEIEFTRAELAAIELLGWANRVFVTSDES